MDCVKLVLFLLVINCRFSVNNATQFKECLLDVITKLNTSLSSPKCPKQFFEFAENLREDKNSWALQMLDATSKIQSGILSLNYGELGNFDQCIRVTTDESETGTILGKYCLGFIPIIIEKNGKEKNPIQMFFTSESIGDLGGSPSARARGPTWAICVPDACNGNDATIIVNTLFESCAGINNTKIGFADLFCQTINDVNQKLEKETIISLIILVLLITVILISTLLDIYNFTNKKDCKYTIIKGLSAYSNGKSVFRVKKSGSEQLPCLDGLKFISMMWIVIGHQYSVFAGGSLTNNKDLINWANSLHSMFIVGGSLAVDTFLLAGGVLMCYSFMKARFKNVPFNIFKYYIHRYLRLTAPFAIVVLVSATMIKYMGSGPSWPLVNLYFQQNCVDYWWSTLLYVQNYVNVKNMCVGQSWYLAVDMQLYFISPAIFFLLLKWPKSSLCLLVIATFGVMGAAFYASWSNNLIAIVSNFYGKSEDFSNKYYLLTHTRAAPWIIGVILGYFIFRIKSKDLRIKINKKIVAVLWAVSLATLFSCIFGGFNTLRGEEYDRWGNALHLAFVRPAWAVAISWIVFACLNNYGGPINWILSLGIYQVFNRFTYCIYLIHVTMLYMIVFSKKTPEYFSEFNMAYYFWGTLWFSTVLSVVLVFMTEVPMITIEKLLFRDIAWVKKNEKSVEDPDNGVVNSAFEK